MVGPNCTQLPKGQVAGGGLHGSVEGLGDLRMGV